VRYIVWGDKDKRVVYGNKNLRWGSPKSYLLEPGDPGYVELQPGEPGYVPPAPEPKKKPRRRSTLSPVNLQPSNHTMAFQYVIIPNPKNPQRPFRARPVLDTQVSADQFLNDVAADAQVTREIVEKVLTSLSKVTVGNMRENKPLAHALGLFRATPTITGAFATNEPTADEVKAGIGFALIVGPEAQAAMVDGLATEKVDEVGTVKPEVETVTLSPGGTPEKYSTTAGLKLGGAHFRGSGTNQPWPRVYLLDDNLANPIELTVIACSQTEMLLAPAPAGTTGPKRLKVVAGWDDDIEIIYSKPLTAA
jgi:hypothetical protein